jgi:hypothetical protein
MLSSVTVTAGHTASKSSSRDMVRPALRANVKRRSRAFDRNATSAPPSRKEPRLTSSTTFPNRNISTQVIFNPLHQSARPWLEKLWNLSYQMQR